MLWCISKQASTACTVVTSELWAQCKYTLAGQPRCGCSAASRLQLPLPAYLNEALLEHSMFALTIECVVEASYSTAVILSMISCMLLDLCSLKHAHAPPKPGVRHTSLFVTASECDHDSQYVLKSTIIASSQINYLS